MSGPSVSQRPASGGSVSSPTATKTSAYTAQANDIVAADASGTSRTVYDLTTTNASPVIGSATANFTAADVGSPFFADGAPIGATILSVQSTTQATLSGNCTSTSSSITASLGNSILPITLPTGAAAGTAVSVKKMDVTSRVVNVLPAGGDTIDGLASVALTKQYQARSFVKGSGSSWLVSAGLTPQPIQTPYGPIVNWIGDSIAPVRSAVPGIGYSATTPGVFLSETDLLAHAHWISNGRMQYGKVGGVSAERADQMAARIWPDALQFGGHFCGITTGTNDASQGRTPALFATDIKNMCQAIVACGQIPILTSGVPNGISTAQDATMDQYRRFCFAYARDNGWPFVDTHSVLVDPTTGGFLAQYDLGDHIHPSNLGKQAMGNAIAQALDPWLPPLALQPPIIGTNTWTANLIVNPLFAGAGPPTSWPKTGGAITITMGTDAAVAGQYVELSDTTSSGYTQIAQAISASALVGHKIAFTGKFKNVGTSGGFNISLATTGATTNLNLKPCNAAALATLGPWQTFYLEAVIPAGTTTITILISSSGGTSVQGYAAQFGLYDLTADGY